jgi:hypothetical protein
MIIDPPRKKGGGGGGFGQIIVKMIKPKYIILKCWLCNFY